MIAIKVWHSTGRKWDYTSSNCLKQEKQYSHSEINALKASTGVIVLQSSNSSELSENGCKHNNKKSFFPVLYFFIAMYTCKHIRKTLPWLEVLINNQNPSMVFCVRDFTLLNEISCTSVKSMKATGDIRFSHKTCLADQGYTQSTKIPEPVPYSTQTQER